MSLKTAMKIYQYAERAKSELIISSKLALSLSGFEGEEKEGGKRMLKLLMDAVGADLQLAHSVTGEDGFQIAADMLDQATGMVERMELDAASHMIGNAVSEVTTIAAGAWNILESHEIL
ncbi:MAG: hypothetical protein ACXQTG_05850 [Methanoculleaceae archaeon]